MNLEPVRDGRNTAYPSMAEYRKNRGSTLVKLLVVLGIAGIAAAVAGYYYFRPQIGPKVAGLMPPVRGPGGFVRPTPPQVQAQNPPPIQSSQGTVYETKE